MTDAEFIIRILAQCVDAMNKGQFSKADLVFIKAALEKLLSATDKTLARTNTP